MGTAGKPPAWLAGSFSAPSSCSGNEAAVGREEAPCPPWRRLRPQHRLPSSGLGPFPLRGALATAKCTLSRHEARGEEVVLNSLRFSANVGAVKTCLALPMRTWKAGTTATFRPLLLKCDRSVQAEPELLPSRADKQAYVAESLMECQLLSRILIDHALVDGDRLMRS